MTNTDHLTTYLTSNLECLIKERKDKLTEYFLSELENIRKQETTNALAPHQNTRLNQKRHAKFLINKHTEECFGQGEVSKHKVSAKFKEILLYSVMIESFQQLLKLLQDETFVTYMKENGVELPQDSKNVTLKMLSDMIPDIINCVSKNLAQDKEKFEALHSSAFLLQFIGWALTIVACAVILVSLWPVVLISTLGLATTMAGIYQDGIAKELSSTYDKITSMLEPVQNTENKTGLSTLIHESIHTCLTEEINNDQWNNQDIALAYRKYTLFSPGYSQYGLNKKKPKDLRDDFLTTCINDK